MTPRQFQILMERRNYRDATWICTYRNMKRGENEAPISPEELLRKRKPTGMGPEVFDAFKKVFTET